MPISAHVCHFRWSINALKPTIPSMGLLGYIFHLTVVIILSIACMLSLLEFELQNTKRDLNDYSLNSPKDDITMDTQEKS